MNPIYQISWWCNVVEKYRSVKYHHRYRASEARFEHASFLSDDTCTHPSFMERIVEHNFHHWCWWRWKGLLCVSTNMRGKKPTLIPSIQYARITLRLWMTTEAEMDSLAFRQILEMGKIVSLVGDCATTRVVKRVSIFSVENLLQQQPISRCHRMIKSLRGPESHLDARIVKICSDPFGRVL